MRLSHIYIKLIYNLNCHFTFLDYILILYKTVMKTYALQIWQINQFYTQGKQTQKELLLYPFNWTLFTDGLLLDQYLDRAGEQYKINKNLPIAFKKLII